MVTLQQLKYFRELAKTKHVTQTAEKLYISQTTLSSTINNLENQLGVKLFDRVGRSILLNESGKKYLKYVEIALEALETGESVIREEKEGKDRSISVATNNSRIWEKTLHDFLMKHPSCKINQNGADRSLWHDMLINQDVDFVLTGSTDIPLVGLECQIVQEDPLYLCVPPNHWLAGRDSASLREVKDEPFINLPKSDAFRSFCDGLFQQAGVEYKAALECDYTLRGSLIRSGFGIAITTRAGQKSNIFGSDVVFVPISDSFARRSFALFWNPRRKLGYAAEKFRDYIASFGLLE